MSNEGWGLHHSHATAHCDPLIDPALIWNFYNQFQQLCPCFGVLRGIQFQSRKFSLCEERMT